jgi:hypothetical protein
MLATGHKGARLGQVILSDHLGLGTFDVAFHARSPKGALKSHQAIFPRNDGAFPTIQLPLPGEEFLL